jgi:hypothetical protein
VRRSTDAPTFFVDRSLGACDVPDALSAAGVRVEIHDDHFAPDTADTAWLSEVGARGWIVLTKDARIRRHPLELQALLAAGVAAFMLTATDLTGADMGRVLAGAIPRADRARANACSSVHRHDQPARPGRDHPGRRAARRDPADVARPVGPPRILPVGCANRPRLDALGEGKVSHRHA